MGSERHVLRTCTSTAAQAAGSARAHLFVALIAATITTTPLPTVAGPAGQIAEIHEGESAAPIFGRWGMVRSGERVLLRSGSVGSELWSTDGTDEGTEFLEEISAGSSVGTIPMGTLVDAAGTIVFVGYTEDNGIELWASDHTPEGTRLLTDMAPGPESSWFSALTAAGGLAFFGRAGSGAPLGTWRSDGTPEGTFWVGPAMADQGVALGELFLFAAGSALWRSDGTVAGTWQVSVAVDRITEMTVVDGTLFFAGRRVGDIELWKSDGTKEGTVRVRDIALTGSSAPTALEAVDDTLFFQADDGLYGRELWRSDGTEAGTVRVRDIAIGPLSSDPSVLTAVEDTLFFGAREDVGSGAATFAVDLVRRASPNQPSSPFPGELFRSDGTEAGTTQVRDIRPGSGGSAPATLTAVGDRLVFTADDGTHGRELWVSDGTEEGTRLVAEVRPGSAHGLSSTAASLAFDEIALVQTLEGLWRSDGTATGTGPLRARTIVPKGSDPSEIVDLDGTIYFLAHGPEGTEVWKSDGTALGTVPVTSFDALFGSRSLRRAGPRVLFVEGNALWSTDGTESGPRKVPGLEVAAGALVPIGHDVLFSGRAIGSNTGFEPWFSDGTAERAYLIRDLEPGPGSSDPQEFTVFADQIVFTALVEREREIWITAGPPETTRMLIDPTPGLCPRDFEPPTRCSTDAANLTVAGAHLYFTSGKDYAARVFRSDGTDPGTASVSPVLETLGQLFPVGDALFFVGADAARGAELWVVRDGGAQAVRVLDLYPGPTGSDPTPLAAFEGTLLFTANDGVHGRELWRSDGTAAGTVRVADIDPGPVGSSITSLLVDGDRIVFGASDGIHGVELWETRGTPETTVLLDDAFPGPRSSKPTGFAHSGDRIFFAADGGTGTELWAIPAEAPAEP